MCCPKNMRISSLLTKESEATIHDGTVLVWQISVWLLLNKIVVKITIWKLVQTVNDIFQKAKKAK